MGNTLELLDAWGNGVVWSAPEVAAAQRVYTWTPRTFACRFVRVRRTDGSKVTASFRKLTAFDGSGTPLVPVKCSSSPVYKNNRAEECKSVMDDDANSIVQTTFEPFSFVTLEYSNVVRVARVVLEARTDGAAVYCKGLTLELLVPVLAPRTSGEGMVPTSSARASSGRRPRSASRSWCTAGPVERMAWLGALFFSFRQTAGSHPMCKHSIETFVCIYKNHQHGERKVATTVTSDNVLGCVSKRRRSKISREDRLESDVHFSACIPKQSICNPIPVRMAFTLRLPWSSANGADHIMLLLFA